MKDVEAALAAMLSERVERIAPADGHRETTLRGARRRRRVSALGTVVTSLAIVAGGFAAVGALETAPPRPPRPAAPDTFTETSGSYGFTSRPGEYPFAATGEFRGNPWHLRVAAVNPGHESPLRITFQIQRPKRNLSTTSLDVPRVDPIAVRYEDATWLVDGNVGVVFGAVDPRAATVDAWINHVEGPNRTYDAHLFEGYDAKAGVRADYYVAFVPADLIGLVIAEDEDGNEVGVASIPTRR